MKLKTEFALPLLDGESRIKNAPSVTLDNGKLCIPQHFLTYQHHHNSVEKIVLDIQYDDRYLIFVCDDNHQLYIQVGVIGVDNYKSTVDSKKLVYGRKWRIEPELPTSEIIQTAFLALKKAREHEVRELFRFHKQGKTTPFNTHHDLPLISQNAELIGIDANQNFQDLSAIKQTCRYIKYDDAMFECIKIDNIGEKWIVQLEVIPGIKTQLPELQKNKITLMLDVLSKNEFYHQLMDSLIRLSDRHVDESFTYQGVARFSRNMDVEKLAKLSNQIRKFNQKEHQEFSKNFVDTNYQVDQSRVPKLNDSQLSKKIRSQLSGFGQLDGILP
ncbi:hypothetical protein [Marinicellulosiphila megalodicopiae]|uniref:hypothetical protein n=1 Tax=Marinicellulosiphila megalodicopiae TaxID=2724896 RepID=UPI003BAF3054